MADKVNKGQMTVEEAGRKGGAKVAAERGAGFYSVIGQKGGLIGGGKVSQDREHMSAIGHKGGERVRELIAKGRKSE
jgi:general stress protein YciG